MPPTYAEILIPQKINGLSPALTYKIPAENPELYTPGKLVEIPLRNRKTRGIIFKVHDRKPEFRTREITRIIENEVSLSPDQIALLEYIADFYFCPLFKALKLFLPAQIFDRKKDFVPTPPKLKTIKQAPHLELTQEQKDALELIKTTPHQTILLHGITGSGKTEIYRRLTTDIIAQGKQALILIPEISLTPQTVKNFQERFGGNSVAIIHSRLTPKQKINYLHQIQQNQIKIIIGSRSAIFAPFHDLGIIIIDEEHEDSYKQDQSPRYHVLEIAQKICEQKTAAGQPIKLILGSATPSIESYQKAMDREYLLIKLTKRIENSAANTALPKIQVVDLRTEIKKKNFSIFSELLQQKMTENLAKKEQTILFLNRRGAASAVICRDCGYTETCPACDVPLTYHSRIMVEESILPAERLICHHCGRVTRIPLMCKKCQSHLIKYLGIGTQKIEHELQKLFPEAKILRADRDTTKLKDSFEEIYKAFRDSQADILIGTQMIGKGLHLPNVTLVGVVLAETSLTIPDYRAAEKTFQLLTQVAGRSGREKPGEVIIQTYLPDHYAIFHTLSYDYENFFKQESEIRAELRYPPFGKLLKLTIEDPDRQKATFLSQQLHKDLQAALPSPLVTEINLYPAMIPKLKNKYRWHILLEGPDPRQFFKNFSLQKPVKSDIKIDVNPLFTV